MIIIKDLCYDSPAGDRLFDGMSVTFPQRKIGLVGKNGVGKTTLLRLILGELEPKSGKIGRDEELASLAQDYRFDLDSTVAGALDIETRLLALKRIKAGDESPELLDAAGGDWALEDRARRKLAGFGLDGIDFSRTLGSLSGGERLKVALAGLDLQGADFLLLDEPTNNLDRAGRDAVYGFVRAWEGGMLVVSHDRELLDLMDQITELTPQGLKAYGGNYSFYAETKSIEAEALGSLLVEARQDLKKKKREELIVRERQKKRCARGKKATVGQKIPKAAINAMKSQANATTGRLKLRHERQVENARNRFEQMQARLPDSNRIVVDLPDSRVGSGKLVAEFDEVSFSYSPDQPLLEKLSFIVCGPERVALVGPNGAGKTTLVKLLLGELNPREGKVRLGVRHTAYLDQHSSLLAPEMTLLSCVRHHSPLSESAARDWLARFLFTDEQVFKPCDALSGGERIRAALAITLAATETPELLILDEPTNNLDLDSIERLESALSSFQGTILVISHDQTFLEHIGVQREIHLDPDRHHLPSPRMSS